VHVHDNVRDNVHVHVYVSVCVDLDVLVLVDVDGILEASSLIVRNEAELFHRIEVEGMNEFTMQMEVGLKRQKNGVSPLGAPASHRQRFKNQFRSYSLFMPGRRRRSRRVSDFGFSKRGSRSSVNRRNQIYYSGRFEYPPVPNFFSPL
jgi:hypothetical protein